MSDGLGLLPRKLDGCELPKGRVALGKSNGRVKLCLDRVGHWLGACDGIKLDYMGWVVRKGWGGR